VVVRERVRVWGARPSRSPSPLPSLVHQGTQTAEEKRSTSVQTSPVKTPPLPPAKTSPLAPPVTHAGVGKTHQRRHSIHSRAHASLPSLQTLQTHPHSSHNSLHTQTSIQAQPPPQWHMRSGPQLHKTVHTSGPPERPPHNLRPHTLPPHGPAPQSLPVQSPLPHTLPHGRCDPPSLTVLPTHHPAASFYCRTDTRQLVSPHPPPQSSHPPTSHFSNPTYQPSPPTSSLPPARLTAYPRAASGHQGPPSRHQAAPGGQQGPPSRQQGPPSRQPGPPSRQQGPPGGQRAALVTAYSRERPAAYSFTQHMDFSTLV